MTNQSKPVKNTVAKSEKESQKVPVTNPVENTKKAVPRKQKTVPATATSTTSVPEPVVSATSVSTDLPPLAAAAATSATTTADVVVLESKLKELIDSHNQKLDKACQSLGVLRSEFRVIEKNFSKELKLSQKQNSKRKRKNENRQPSGFVKPTRISDELALFLNKPPGSEMARTQVTKEINNYIRANNLQDPSNGRIIHPDKKLLQLLQITAEQDVTYFNLQRYMRHHYPAAASNIAAAAAAEISGGH